MTTTMPSHYANSQEHSQRLLQVWRYCRARVEEHTRAINDFEKFRDLQLIPTGLTVEKTNATIDGLVSKRNTDLELLRAMMQAAYEGMWNEEQQIAMMETLTEA